MTTSEVRALCSNFRIDVIRQLHAIQTGHPGGSLSVCEILAALYFLKAKVFANDPQNPTRDRIILSKGHAAPMLYRILAERGFFSIEDLARLRQYGSQLQGHPSLSTPGVELPAGPLGLGLSAGIGIALSLRLDENPAWVYVVLGDGELNEGTIWEAAMSASKFRLEHLIAIVDVNHVQLDGTSDEIMPLPNLRGRFEAFGWNVLCCDGHDLDSICGAIDAAKSKKGAPSVILAECVKGKGVSFMEGKNVWHGSPISDDLFRQAMHDLGGDLDG